MFTSSETEEQKSEEDIDRTFAVEVERQITINTYTHELRSHIRTQPERIMAAIGHRKKVSRSR